MRASPARDRWVDSRQTSGSQSSGSTLGAARTLCHKFCRWDLSQSPPRAADAVKTDGMAVSHHTQHMPCLPARRMSASATASGLTAGSTDFRLGSASRRRACVVRHAHAAPADVYMRVSPSRTAGGFSTLSAMRFALPFSCVLKSPIGALWATIVTSMEISCPCNMPFILMRRRRYVPRSAWAL